SMLKEGRRFAVLSDNRPSVFERFRLVRAHVQHRLERETVSCSDPLLPPSPSMIRDLRRLAHRTPDAVARVVPDDAIAELLGMSLDRSSDVSDTIVRTALLDPQHQTFLGHPDQLFQVVRDLADRDRYRGVSHKSVQSTRHIERDDV